MKINRKLLIGFLVISILTLSISYMSGLLVQEETINSFQEVGGELLPGNVALARMTTELYHALVLLSKFAETGELEDKQKIEKALSTMSTYMTMHRLYHPEDEAWHKNVEESIQRFSSYITEYILLIQRGAKEEELYNVKLKIDEVLDNFVSSVNPQIEDHFVKSAMTLEATRQNTDKARMVLIGSSFVVLVIAVGLSLFISHLLSRPLLNLRDAALEIGKGRLDITFPAASKDEIGELAHAFNEMIGNLTTAREELISSNLQLQKESLEHKQTSESLKDSEERYGNLFSSIRDVIIMADEEQKVIVANQPALRELFGYELGDIVGSQTRMLYADEAGFTNKGKEIFDEHGALIGRIIEANFRKKDGKVFVGELYALKMLNREGVSTGNIGIIRDITGRKTLEKQLLQAQKMESIGTLAGGVAHDFNNFLTAIVGYGNILKMKIVEEDPLRHYVDQILASSERAASLTQSLLAFSRKQIISPKPVNANSIVENIYKLLKSLIGEDIELNITVTKEDLIILADNVQIEQILMNLATNAKDSMPDGGTLSIVTERVFIDENYIKLHGYGTPGPFVLISVTDTGTGMDKEIKDKIFEPFYTTKEVDKGTGLGLAMVYGIVKQHNGYINIYSELSRGTTFKIYFPIIKEEVERVEKIEIEPLSGRTETVLVAEDDETARRMTKIALEAYGYKVIEAVDGDDAINKFKENRESIQIAILDVIMPKRNGRDVFDEIEKIKPDMKALFTSGYTADIIHKKGILEEKLHFLSKPFSPQELLRTIREILNGN
jgi:PAS domain S-box-containing protein